MIYCDSQKYSALFSEYDIKEIEKKNKILCLYGGLTGSRLFETQTKTSDYDVTIIFEDAKEEKTIFYDNTFHNITVDFMGYEITNIMKQNHLICSQNVCFPTFYTPQRRSPSSDQGMEYIRLLASDFIWDSGYLKKNLETLLKKTEPILLLDYLFSRAAGNLQNSLSTLEVQTKRVLRTIHGINQIYWILEHQSIPYLNFKELTKLYHKGNMLVRIREILEIHQYNNLEKKSAIIQRDDVLNQYISNCLLELEKKIREIPLNSMQLKVEKESFLGKLIQSGQF